MLLRTCKENHCGTCLYRHCLRHQLLAVHCLAIVKPSMARAAPCNSSIVAIHRLFLAVTLALASCSRQHSLLTQAASASVLCHRGVANSVPNVESTVDLVIADSIVSVCAESTVAFTKAPLTYHATSIHHVVNCTRNYACRHGNLHTAQPGSVARPLRGVHL
jgi:hypothetical protein